MARILVATFKPTDFVSVRSAIKNELTKLPYEGKVWFEKGTWHIRGKQQIETFVQAMQVKINECEQMFSDPESIAEYESDRKLLKQLSLTKAT